MAIFDKVKPKTRGIAGSPSQSVEDLAEQSPGAVPADTKRIYSVDKRTYSVFRALLSASSDGIGEVAKSVKWTEFRRAMVRLGFSAEKLQGSAWQFIPLTDVGTKRSIQFHKPHPDSETTYVISKRMGRRLRRVYGWHGDTFALA